MEIELQQRLDEWEKAQGAMAAANVTTKNLGDDGAVSFGQKPGSKSGRSEVLMRSLSPSTAENIDDAPGTEISEFWI